MIMKENSEKIREIIKNEVLLCVSGKSFDFLLQKFKEECEFNEKFLNIKLGGHLKDKEQSDKNSQIVLNYNFNDSSFEKQPYAGLLKLILNKGRIFFRMSPKDKVDLVNFFKEDKNSIVAMCGDGANDCGALLSADVGISVKQTKGNNITAHFY